MLLVHNTAPFRLIRAAAPHLREPAKKEQDQGLPQQQRSIVNVVFFFACNAYIRSLPSVALWEMPGKQTTALLRWASLA